MRLEGEQHDAGRKDHRYLKGKLLDLPVCELLSGRCHERLLAYATGGPSNWPPEHPLWSLPNVILTPHISGSGAGRKFLPRVWGLFAENLARCLAGKPLLNELSAAKLASVGAD